MNNYQTHKHNTNLFMLKATIGIVLLSTLIVAFPGLSEAKTIHQSTTLSKSKARTISISATLLDPKPSTAEKPILNTLTVSSNSKIESAIDLYPKMAVVRIEPARPFYIFSRAKSVGLKLSSLTPGAKYYLYKEKLRNPTIFTANEEGSYSLSLDTPRHRYLILKTTELEMKDDGKSSPKKTDFDDKDFKKNLEAAQTCPVNVIHIVESATKKKVI